METVPTVSWFLAEFVANASRKGEVCMVARQDLLKEAVFRHDPLSF